jgi:hypothetical protein
MAAKLVLSKLGIGAIAKRVPGAGTLIRKGSAKIDDTVGYLSKHLLGSGHVAGLVKSHADDIADAAFGKIVDKGKSEIAASRLVDRLVEKVVDPVTKAFLSLMERGLPDLPSIDDHLADLTTAMDPTSVQSGLNGDLSGARTASKRSTTGASTIVGSTAGVIEQVSGEIDINLEKLLNASVDMITKTDDGDKDQAADAVPEWMWNALEVAKDYLLSYLSPLQKLLAAGTGWVTLLQLIENHQRGIEGVIRGRPPE